MSLARSFLNYTAGASLFILTAGVVASPLAGCSTAFCIAPVLNLASQILGITPIQSNQNNQPTQPTQSNKPDKPSAAPHNPVTAPDIRLSVCPAGSVEPTAPEIPSTLASHLGRRISQGVTFKSLPEIQGYLGQPRCNFRDGKSIRWRYLIRGGGFVDATETSGKVEVKISE